MNRRLITFIFIAAVFASSSGILLWRVVVRREAPSVSQSYKTSLVEDCEQNVQEDGFGHVVITQSLDLENQTLNFSTNCTIELKADVQLTLSRVTMTTQKLYITTENTHSKAKVSINDTTVVGAEDSGLQITLQGANSLIEVTHSSIRMGRSIGLASGSTDDDRSSRITITDSNIALNGAVQEGVVLASTGSLNIANNAFSTASADAIFAVGLECVVQNNTGLSTRCISKDEMN